MTKSTKRAIRAFAVAPLVPVALFFLVDPDGAGRSGRTFLGILLFGGPYAYLTALIVGLPTYWLINQHSRLRALHIFAVASAAGATVFPMMAPDSGYTVLAGAALGWSAGLAFWLLWRGRAAEPAVADGRGPRLRAEPRR